MNQYTLMLFERLYSFLLNKRSNSSHTKKKVPLLVSPADIDIHFLISGVVSCFEITAVLPDHSIIQIKLLCSWSIFATLGLHLGFSAKLRIWQVPTCKMEPRSGYIMQLEPPTHPAHRISLKSVPGCKMEPQNGI